MPVEMCSVNVLFNIKLKHSFNSFAVDSVFKNPGPLLVVGHEDGMVRTYELPSSDTLTTAHAKASFETKGGPIQALLVHDVTKLHSNDLVVGDSRGIVTVFNNGQILARKMTSEHCIHFLHVEKDSTGNFGIVMADGGGNLLAFTPYFDLWRLRLADIQQLKGLSSRPKILSLLPVSLNTPHGVTATYLLATDDSCHLFFLRQGIVVLILQTPANVTAMCAGKFIDPSEIDSSLHQSVLRCFSLETQVALGTDSGSLYIMTNFEIYEDEFSNIKLPITQLQSLPATEAQKTDTILAIGNFNSVYVLRNGKTITCHQTKAWVSSIVTKDINQDGVEEVIIGCRDNSFQGLKLTFS